MVYYAANSSGIWPVCNGTATDSQNIWQGWITTSSNSTTTIWPIWISSTSSTTGTWCQWANNQDSFQPAQILSEEEHNRICEEAMRQAAAEREKREAAAKRAMRLLYDNLTAKQLEALNKHGWFLVEGGKSKKTYRIYGNRYAGNIHELNAEGKEVLRYCVHAECTLPLGDQLLAQAISLRFDEDYIISKANKTRLVA